MINVIVIEDSELAREGLVNMLAEFSELHVIAQVGDANSARQAIEKYNPELLFVDIHMPGDSGLELLESLSSVPQVIFTTAYAEYAIRSFDFPTVDYLLKPIRKERLATAVEKFFLTQQSDVVNEKLAADHRMFIKNGEQCDIVMLGDISCFESCKNYSIVYFNGKKSFIKKSLSHIEKRLPEKLFFRASRQHIINFKEVINIEEWVNDGFIVTLTNGNKVELSRRQANKLKDILSF